MRPGLHLLRTQVFLVKQVADDDLLSKQLQRRILRDEVT